MSIGLQIGVAFAFLLLNVLVLCTILAFGRRVHKESGQPSVPSQPASELNVLDPADILGKEYVYAQNTASEAMRDRHTMIQFYLVLVSVIATGVTAVIREGLDSSWLVGTVLMWLLLSIGWLYFLKVIRLRQAWHESARTMNQIKEFYIYYSKNFEGNILRSAFRWHSYTLPKPEKPWTLFFLSAMTISFVDSVAFVVGGILLSIPNVRSSPLLVIGSLIPLGLAFLGFHVWLYSAFLTEQSAKQ
jgi:hypothetical protein